MNQNILKTKMKEKREFFLKKKSNYLSYFYVT